MFTPAQESKKTNQFAIEFCEEFLKKGNTPKFVFGINEYSNSIHQNTEINGFIDDYTKSTSHLGLPVIRSENIPQNALVVSAVVLGRPITAKNRLDELGIKNLDYFLFKKHSKLDLVNVLFHEDFPQEFENNKAHYYKLYEKLSDRASQIVFEKLINFRLTSDLSHMTGFVDNQKNQYFEDFLELKPDREIFLDVGCFDGYTSTEFAKRNPNYDSIHVFEPESKNMATVKNRLLNHSRITYHNFGLSNRQETLRFKSQGSASTISEDGDTEIQVNRLDNIDGIDQFTFMKMDIEGGEIPALQGAQLSIMKSHPKLAISAYHKIDDFVKIPETILGIRDDYSIFLRHYTEGVTETVLFFVPIKKNV